MDYIPSSEPEIQNWEEEKTEPTPIDKYFEAYSRFPIHEDMLKDKVRTKAYRDALMRNKYLIHDKIVLDVGCGTGILSFFAVRAGAKHVYAIDSADIIETASKIAELNSIKNITFIKGKVEEISLPTKFVDIIISEWMGYMLLYENMLESVIYARDKWLIPGGILFPDKAKITIAAIEDGKYKDEKIEFWHDVYGTDMSVFREISLKEALIEEINSESMISTSCPIFDVDLETITASELNFISNYSLQFTRKDFMHAIVGWFEVIFSHCHKPITLSTSPRLKFTHWKHTIFYLEASQPVDVGQIIHGSFALRKNPIKPRETDFKISYHLDGPYPLNTYQFYQLTR